MSQVLPPLDFVPEDDPVIPLPSREEMERALEEIPVEFTSWLRARQEDIRRRNENPYGHGFEPAIWHVVDDLLVRGKRVVLIDPVDGTPKEILGGSEVYISGGNRASKTDYAAKRLVRKMVEKRGARVWAFHTTGPSSIAMQQPRVWYYLPNEWKGLKRHRMADIRYSQKNGFAGVSPTFVGPNESQCWFKNYAQGVDTLEGDELDMVWVDELVPLDFIDAIRFRLATRKGVLVITFTAVNGYTATVKELIDRAKDVMRVPALELPVDFAKENSVQLPGGKRFETVPRVQQAAYEPLKIVYFHIFDNPFGNPPEIVAKARAKGRDGILLRCYGVATKAIGAAFPTFREAIHVITEEAFRKAFKEGTNKHYVDPCSGRNWFHIWARATVDGRMVVYREWPSPQTYIPGVGDPGWWAEADGEKHDGKRGDAQKPWGFGLKRYGEEILRAEGWRDEEIVAAIASTNCTALPKRQGARGAAEGAEEIYERMMDSRFGNSPTLTASESKTLIESMRDDVGMEFEPTPGEHLREGIDQLNDLLYYDPEKPIDFTNRPKLLIVESCRNVIWALENWTGLDGAHGASKDPIDLLRYMALSPPEHFPPEALMCRGGGSY